MTQAEQDRDSTMHFGKRAGCECRAHAQLGHAAMVRYYVKKIWMLVFCLGILVGGVSKEFLDRKSAAANNVVPEAAKAEDFSFWSGVDIGQTLVACQYVANIPIYDVSLVKAAEWARAGAYSELFEGFSPEKCRVIAQRYRAYVQASNN